MAEDNLEAGGNGERYSLWTPQQREYIRLRIQGLTMRDAAAAVGVCQNTATNWENHRPELNMKTAIEAGQAYQRGLGSEAAVHELSNTVESVCNQVTGPITMAVVSELLAKHNAVEHVISTAMTIMLSGKRDIDRLQAAKLIAQISGIDQPPKLTRTEETKTLNGISPSTQEIINRDLLGVQMRQAAWDSMRAEPPQE